jgi:putative ABC transport system substrate-binding protein
MDSVGLPEMPRRAFVAILAGGLLSVPLAAAGQPAGKGPRIGYLSSGRRPTAPDDVSAESIRVIRESLGALGYVEGQNLGIEYRFAEDRSERLPALAAALVALQVDLILAIGPASVRAAKDATSTIPIAAFDFESDPVGAGFAASLARPAGNITGIFLDQAELVGKWLDLIKEAVPGLSRVAALREAGAPVLQVRAIETGARALGLKLQELEVREPREFAGAFAAATRGHAQAVVILSSPTIARSGAQLSSLAIARRLPTISLFRENVTAGCLMAYGPSLTTERQHVASIAARILKGVKPGDLPIERPTRLELVINLKTAKTLGLTIPPSLLQRADQVIE